MELGDIENIILKIPGVKTVKVIADKNDNNDVIAYIVLENHVNTFKYSEIRNLCRQKLPHYMIPRTFQFLEKLPITENFKIDITKLPPPNYSNKNKHKVSFKEDNYEQENLNKQNVNQNSQKNDCNVLNSQPEDNTLKENILQIISSTLNITNIETFLNDNFIYLGGNSLNGQRIINDINSTFLLNNSLVDLSLFLNTNFNLSQIIVSIIKIIKKTTNIKKSAEQDTEFRYETIPLSFQQEQMYYLSQIDYKKLYILPLIQKFSYELNFVSLHYAFMKVIQDHAILRTIVHETKEFDLCQHVLSTTESYHKCKTQNLPLFTKENILKFFKEKFDLMKEPPIKCQIFLADNYYVLILLMHHIASDATTTSILENNIKQNYNDHVDLLYSNKKLEIAKKSSVNEYLLWSFNQKKLQSLKEIDKNCNKLALELMPFINKRLIIENYFHAKSTIKKTTNYKKKFLTKQFSISRKIFQKYSFTTYVLIIAAFIKSFVNYLKQSFNYANNDFNNLYILLGSPVSNRLNKKNENVIGNYLNNIIIAFPLDIFANSDILTDEIFNLIKNKVKEAQKFENIPYGKILNAIRQRCSQLYSNERLYNIYINCRYNLESESHLKTMKHAIIDHHFTEETLDYIKNDNNELNHFIELDIDQQSDCYDIKLKVSTTNESIKNDTNLIFKFFNLFENQCQYFSVKSLQNISSAVHQAINETLAIEIQFTNNETFFSIGGNSLLLIKLRRLLEKKLNISIDLLDLVNNLEIAKMIQLCEKSLPASISNNIEKLKIDKDVLLLKSKIEDQASSDKNEKFEFALINENLSSFVIQRLYSSPNFNEKINSKTVIVMFHALLGGNLAYMTLKDSIKKFNTNNLVIIGVQHPETFCKTKSDFPQNSLKKLADYYGEQLENYLNRNNLLENTKIVFIGASMGATIAYEVCIFLRNNISVNLVKIKNIKFTKLNTNLKFFY